MTYPFHRLVGCSHVAGDIIFAACGPKILSLDAQKGDLLSSWPASEEQIARIEDPEQDGPPGKKRKLTNAPPKAPAVVELVISHDSKHLVAVTAEDKCVRVFEIGPSGSIRQLSERCMPKRPYAISITDDNVTILCGDKFGDVFALPLLPTESELNLPPEEETKATYKPSANVLTVHSGRNRRALETQQQMQQKQMQQKEQTVKPKEHLRFAHQLLLGHVSMLTDVISVTIENEDGKKHPYILTCDRDEHIRISRGIPQSHIIETFCLGHEEFVSKLCLVTRDILVSGGGDDRLFLWDWRRGKLLNTVDIRDCIAGISRQNAGTGSSEEQGGPKASVAVTGLQIFKYRDHSTMDIIATLEAVPALIRVPLKVEDKLAVSIGRPETLPLEGNSLDLVILGDELFVAIDTFHAPGSTEAQRQGEAGERLQRFALGAGQQWENMRLDISAANRALRTISSNTADEPVERAFWEQVYNTERLRKRAGASAEEPIPE